MEELRMVANECITLLLKCAAILSDTQNAPTAAVTGKKSAVSVRVFKARVPASRDDVRKILHQQLAFFLRVCAAHATVGNSSTYATIFEQE